MSNESPRPHSSLITHHSSLVGVVDADLHHQIADWGAVAPFAPAGLRHRVARRGRPPIARHGFAPVGVAERRGRATDPAQVREQYLAARGVDRAILTGPILS